MVASNECRAAYDMNFHEEAYTRGSFKTTGEVYTTSYTPGEVARQLLCSTQAKAADRGPGSQTGRPAVLHMRCACARGDAAAGLYRLGSL